MSYELTELRRWHEEKIAELTRVAERFEASGEYALVQEAIGAHRGAIQEITRRLRPLQGPASKYGWELLFKNPRGHYFWRDKNGRYAISDESADAAMPRTVEQVGFPEDTDDGVLWLTGEVHLQVARGFVFTVWSERMETELHVSENFSGGLGAIRQLKFEIKLAECHEKNAETRALMLGACDSVVQRLAADSLLYPINGRLVPRVP